jgi:hypothetical protein
MPPIPVELIDASGLIEVRPSSPTTIPTTIDRMIATITQTAV